MGGNTKILNNLQIFLLSLSLSQQFLPFNYEGHSYCARSIEAEAESIERNEELGSGWIRKALKIIIV
jgi:hypothetical protein